MTQAEIVVLGILINKDRYGYEIEKHIESNNMREWTKIGFSSIYNILNKLHKKKLIDFRYEDEKYGPKRKVYFILDEGKKVFNSTLVNMIKTPVISKQDLDVGIVFSLFIDPGQVKNSLIEHKKALIATIENYKELFERKYSHKQTVAMLFRRSVLHMETDIKWIDEILENMN